MAARWPLTLTRWLVPLLVVALPLTAFLVFAAGDVLMPHPDAKHASSAAHASAKLPSVIGTTGAVLAAPVLAGRLATAVAPAVVSVVLGPPFVPPRA